MTFAGALVALLFILDLVLILAWVDILAAACCERRRPGRRPGTDREPSPG